LQEENGVLKKNKKKEIHPLSYTHNIYAKPTSLERKKSPPGSQGVGTDAPIFLSDLQLARKALSDSRTEEALLRRVYPKIYKVVRITVGCQNHLDDIAQLAAMEVARSLDRYGGRGSLEAWAGRIAYRMAMRVIKRQRKKEMGRMPLFDRDRPNNETPEKLISRRQLFENFVSKMGKIPAKRRVPLFLRLAYGYTVKEVSELTDASPNTVKDRLRTAFRELQTVLDENPGLVTAMLEELP
jgi:RNA polymerase sigma-70 factor (ECF subfamily)